MIEVWLLNSNNKEYSAQIYFILLWHQGVYKYFSKLKIKTDIPEMGEHFSPCSSFTAHTMRSTQAALAWQRSFRGLSSLCSRSTSWRIFWSSDWLLLNCSNTKSWISFTNELERSKEIKEDSISIEERDPLDQKNSTNKIHCHVMTEIISWHLCST